MRGGYNSSRLFSVFLLKAVVRKRKTEGPVHLSKGTSRNIYDFIHYSNGRLESSTTTWMITDKYFWSEVGQDVFRYVET